MNTVTELQTKMQQVVSVVKSTTPLAPSITNTVTINFVANTQLAVGGSAAMIYLPDEGITLAQMANSFYLNSGTLEPFYTETFPATAKAMHEQHKNWVLDPVALGIGTMRTNLMHEFKSYKPTIIKGNASEIIALASLWELIHHQDSTVKGVDTTDTVDAARQAAVALAQYTSGAVVVSGTDDLVTDGQQVIMSHGGSPMMGLITGAGCSLGGVINVYATSTDPLTAALTGVQIYNLAGQRAAELANGPASFQTAFIDALYHATAEEIAHNPFDVEAI
ncbi:hydroxyethylthiazole kinase [Weissella diestrammenae]|uniref:Hydroxyethylthiazole kinase n=1 Tax=Weissella diestrammenae TaxID=1162633 RepID=A0A7G9T715_9LACO|nr:hydroxyethylthiazole kinase [Weissella diestrammenae]MCM0582513.1 hydroxyethylthiazole kinase [Weissella diestrammenae]QNN75890.1 hydroxyethylthiazole kinase [Weissella diestrammenae]